MQDHPSSIYPFTFPVIIGKHSNLKKKNAIVGGNGDHTSNTVVAHMKAYTSQ